MYLYLSVRLYLGVYSLRSPLTPLPFPPHSPLTTWRYLQAMLWLRWSCKFWDTLRGHVMQISMIICKCCFWSCIQNRPPGNHPQQLPTCIHIHSLITFNFDKRIHILFCMSNFFLNFDVLSENEWLVHNIWYVCLKIDPLSFTLVHSTLRFPVVHLSRLGERLPTKLTKKKKSTASDYFKYLLKFNSIMIPVKPDSEWAMGEPICILLVFPLPFPAPFSFIWYIFS